MSSLPLPIAAFVAGIVSFLSPCVLPLVPGYVSLISGAGVEELQSQQAGLLRKVMLNSLAFIVGFSVVFITLGALSTAVGQLLARYKSVLAQVAGVVIILFGLHLTGIFRINALYADKRLHSVKGGSTMLGAFVIGFAFAFGWTPFLLTSLGIERFLKFYSRFRAHMHALEVASGALLIVLGALLVFGRFTLLSNYLSFLSRFSM
jgi:cytochrome c-type biogenesis protein